MPGNILTGSAFSEGIAAVKFSLQQLAQLGSRHSGGYFLTLFDQFLHCAIDCVNTVVGRCAKLIQGVSLVLFGVLLDELTGLAFSGVCIEVAQHRNFLADSSQVHLACQTVEAVAAIVDGVLSNGILSLLHKDSSGLIVDRHKDEGAFLQLGDLSGEVSCVGIGELRLNNSDILA